MTELRRAVLEALGATGGAVDELLAYGANPLLEAGMPELPTLPLADEPHIVAWRDYADEARARGPWPSLKDRLVQLRFPIREGVSQEDSYRAATRRGEWPEPDHGLELDAPDRLELHLHPSLAGTVPVLVPGPRSDFVAIARALSSRNEPVTMPDSMGACLVTGLVNWDRVARYRRSWAGDDPDRQSDAAWSEEFRAFSRRKELYQDRLIVLSRGPYSNVSAADVGLHEADWLDASFKIRREHECTHHFTLRLFGRLQHNLVEELVADLVGLLRGVGSYRADWAARFLGLESFPTFRPGGRLENYRGKPPVSDRAFEVLTRVAHAAIATLDRVCVAHPEWCTADDGLARLAAALSLMTMEELAAKDGMEKVEDRVATLFG